MQQAVSTAIHFVFKFQGMQGETKSFTARRNSAEQVTSSSQNKEGQGSQSGRGVTGKSLVSEEGSSHCKHKFYGLQLRKDSPVNCPVDISIAEETTQNSKVQKLSGSSVQRPGNCVRDTCLDTVVIVDDDTDTGLSTCDVSSSTEQEDDDRSTEMDTGHAISSAEIDTCRPNFYYWQRQSSNSSLPVSLSVDVSDDEDDCQVFEPCSHLKSNSRIRRKKQKQFSSGCFRYISESDSDGSDCEIMDVSCGEIRQMWEEAALKKRATKGFQQKQHEAGVEASVSCSNLAANSPIREGGPEVTTLGKDADFESRNAGESLRNPCDFASESGINESSYQMNAASFRTSKEFDTGYPSTSGVNMSDKVIPGCDTIDMNLCTGPNEINKSSNREAGNEHLPANTHHQFQEEENPKLIGTCTSEECEAESVMNENLEWISDREKLKESAEFISANQEEWAYRQLELQRQAKEVQQLRRRRRAEATRMLEMERRQKQRLEEIRITQKKEEQTMDLKEQLRDQVRLRLEEVASRCKDMASLLRCLGVQVEGGSLPSSQQVSAAYKKALLKFHPDRASVSKGGLRHQVEAEETFKMISRLKDTLLPIATSYANKTYW